MNLNLVPILPSTPDAVSSIQLSIVAPGPDGDGPLCGCSFSSYLASGMPLYS
ncbi:conserved hypothetical protein [Ricinus communis]|uniref:Uncharacterized protein n=1 Tax=Ricinus communis TaxID=3988 RepID=B9RIQ1_RICCO|nr:conserved hypothetical protein [Ricinus communis]